MGNGGVLTNIRERKRGRKEGRRNGDTARGASTLIVSFIIFWKD